MQDRVQVLFVTPKQKIPSRVHTQAYLPESPPEGIIHVLQTTRNKIGTKRYYFFPLAAAIIAFICSEMLIAFSFMFFA